MMTDIDHACVAPTFISASGAVRPTTRTLRKVMVVGRQPNQRVLETLADAGDYDIVIVEATARAYSHIKRVVPNLVVLCLEIDDPDGCHLLSMLKLDNATSWIPVMTYASAGNEPGDDDDGDDVVNWMN
jgi:CheY-like chemotaxis protein